MFTEGAAEMKAVCCGLGCSQRYLYKHDTRDRLRSKQRRNKEVAALIKKPSECWAFSLESAYGATLIPAFNVATIVAFAKNLDANFDAFSFQFAFFIFGSPRTGFFTTLRCFAAFCLGTFL